MIGQNRPAPLARAVTVWGVGALAYMVAVAHRTSLGVAGIEATERFNASASVLASFAVFQIVVYAAAQVPVGIALDRFGPRALIAGGAALMAIGQLTLALATVVPLAVVARGLLGLGDALTFVSVLRLAPSWFPRRRVPLVTQLTGILGQLGQVISAVPLLAILGARGWTTGFSAMAALGALATVAVVLVVRDAPPGQIAPRGPSIGLDGLREAGAQPGTWLGFWTHFVTPFSTHSFVFLWGFPFLVGAHGLAPASVSALLVCQVVAGIVLGPVLGELMGRRPRARLWMVIATLASLVLTWSAVLAYGGPDPTSGLLPGAPPMALLVVWMVVLAVGATGSLIGFDFASDHNPPRRLGTATGLVNSGGFIATLVTILAIGLVLDVRAPGGAPSVADYRAAFAVMAVPMALGLVGVLRSNARTHA